MLRCYILDDEQHAVDGLTAMLKKKFAGQAEVCGSQTKASKAIEEIEELEPDVLFLDVEMPEMTGLDVLKQFPTRKFHVIFTTAHEKYALPALKAEAADYLVKPLSPQDVFDAIQKCIQRKSAAGNNTSGNRISLATTQEIVLVNTDDIIRIEANNNYSHFYFTNRPRLIVSKTLKEFEEQLTPFHFYRVHQSHLVNMKYVESVHSNDGDYILLTGGHRVEISRRKKPEFMQLIRKS
ncbi:MAG: LytTR family DNA-binding domain-containing protein [Bacteroidetes bacterium]|nr:LytTR family DNA-binding domain-containing protein [Bacteroidota bacterium]